MNFIRKNTKILLLILFVGLFNPATAYTSELSYEITDSSDSTLNEGTPTELFKFRQKFEIDSDNIITTLELRRLSLKVDSILSIDSVINVRVTGISSVDGPEELNNRLAKARAETMAYWLRNNTQANSSLITTAWIGEDWTWFYQLVENDMKIPEREKVMEIIRSKVTTIPQKETELRNLAKGETWRYLAENIFPQMRVSELVMSGYPPQKTQETTPREDKYEPIFIEETTPQETETISEEEVSDFVHKLYIKTNAPAWLMLWMNVAVEYDLAPHWSVALPIYYSGFNYFTSKLKFRTFAVVPEIRWWTRRDNMGFFLNAHLGLNQFNYAKGGKWRYQTYKGHTPALGGGIGLGYRWYFCKNHHWSMEAALGAGIYHLDYSIFENIHNGLIVGRRQRTFIGVDQVALSFEYSFGVKERRAGK